MPKTVKLRRSNPPNLLKSFKTFDITPATTVDTTKVERLNYAAQSDLLLWLRFEKGNPVDLVNYDPNNKPTIIYEGTENTDIESVYANQMKVARFSNATGFVNAKLTFPNGEGNRNILSFGDGSSSDLPFSVSFWFRKVFENDGSETIDPLFYKGKSTTKAEFEGSITTTRRVTFELYGSKLESNRQKIQTGTNAIDLGVWYHYVFTYDGRGTSGGSTPSDGMKIYLNGELQSTTTSNAGSYTYMDDISEQLYIGGNSGAIESDGSMAEFAIWSKELSLEEIRAIYNWTYESAVVKSGYTNLPPRVMLRNHDNRPGCYPTKHRAGDKDRSGKQNIFYEDLPIQFGRKIEDEFNLESPRLYGSSGSFDQAKWVPSSGMSIRTEHRKNELGEVIRDQCAVFSGGGSGGKRYLRTKEKIINPTFVYFELIQGPYKANVGLAGLFLRFGDPEHSIKIEISADAAFTNPITIANYALEGSLPEFFDVIQTGVPLSKKVKLGLGDFLIDNKHIGSSTSYYLRFVQDSFSDNVANWAIRSVCIEYADQKINHPLLVSHRDKTGNKISLKQIVKPNFSGSFATTGRSVKGTSDVISPFQEFTEDVSPFNETLVVENSDDEFFNQGIDPDIYPGFSSPARSKTKFTVDLTPNTSTTFGYTTRLTATDTNRDDDVSGNGQRLMVYWNSHLKRWEKIGKALHHGNFSNGSGGTGFATTDGMTRVMSQQLTQSCLGFAPQPRYLFSGSSVDSLAFHEEAYLRQAFKKTDTYNFPFGPQYFASSSFVVKAKDIGITKPFLLEKTLVDFNANFQFGRNDVSPGFHDSDSSSPSLFGTGLDNKNSSYVPTFFMLRQHKDAFIHRGAAKISVNLSVSPFEQVTTVPAGFEIPGFFELQSGSHALTYVDSTRELITYNNIQFFMSMSDASGVPRRPDGTFFQFDDFLNTGLSADANHIRYYTLAESQLVSLANSHPPFSGRFSMGSSVKVKSIFPEGLITTKIRGVAGQTAQIHYANNTISSNEVTKNSRYIFNGYPSFKPEKKILLPGHNAPTQPFSTTVPENDSVEQTAAYVILPEDELIFGWQYPVNVDPSLQSGGSDTVDGRLGSMTLEGASKLHLYGSLIAENKEYHETVNQNLTSCAVYEHVIGDEKVLDQWEVAYRGELTGSFITRQVIEYSDQGERISSENENPDAWKYAFNNYVCFSSGIATDITSFNDISNNKGIKRIGLQSLSFPIGDFNKVMRMTRQMTLRGYSGSPLEKGLAFLYATQIHRPKYYVNPRQMVFFDQQRIFTDSTKDVGTFHKIRGGSDLVDRGSSGTYGIFFRLDLFLDPGAFWTSFLSPVGRSKFFGHGPNYSFSPNHFGHYADMRRQGLDGKFERVQFTPDLDPFDVIINARSPVRAIFVEQENVEGSEQKIYKRRRLEFLLDDENFQSSNLSTFATSSFPFKDDNTPRNRSYITNPIVTLGT